MTGVTPPPATPSPTPAAGQRPPVGKLASISIDCTDPAVLAAFYSDLLGLRRVFTTDDESIIALSDGAVALTLMRVPDHTPPTWPKADRPQQMHLDVSVTDLEHAVVAAAALGATQATHQPHPALWRVLLDPAGHPFCLTTVTGD